MYCKNCNRNLNKGELFCSNCGLKVESGTNDMNQQSCASLQLVDSSKNKDIKILVIVGVVVVSFIVGLVVLVIMLFLNVFDSSEKLVCKSNEGDITIMYNESGITGYMANGMSYDLDSQQEYAKKVGIDTYIIEFNNWFISNTSGICTINGKEV